MTMLYPLNPAAKIFRDHVMSGGVPEVAGALDEALVILNMASVRLTALGEPFNPMLHTAWCHLYDAHQALVKERAEA